MKVLGLDLAPKSTGWAVYDGTLIDSGIMKANGKLSDTLAERIKEHVTTINELITSFDVDVIAVEDSFIGRNSATGIQLARFNGAVFKLSLEHDKPFYVIHNSTIKAKFAGNGRAKKPDMIKKANELYPDVEIINDDHADAIGTAYTYFHYPEKAKTI